MEMTDLPLPPEIWAATPAPAQAVIVAQRVGARPAAGGAVAQAPFRVGQRGRQSVCRAAADRGGNLSSAGPAAAGLPGGCRRSGASGSRPPIAPPGTTRGLNAYWRA